MTLRWHRVVIYLLVQILLAAPLHWILVRHGCTSLALRSSLHSFCESTIRWPPTVQQQGQWPGPVGAHDSGIRRSDGVGIEVKPMEIEAVLPEIRHLMIAPYELREALLSVMHRGSTVAGCDELGTGVSLFPSRSSYLLLILVRSATFQLCGGSSPMGTSHIWQDESLANLASF